jgi:hypothetical protein
MSRALTAARTDGNERDSQRETPAMSATISAPRRLALPLALGGATALLHLLTASDGWDLFRDELYYIANGRRPSLGYVDHPPMIGWLTWAVLTLLGDSKLALRLLPALAGGATVFFTCRIARTLGGRQWAELLAGTAAATAPALLAAAGYLSMNAFDLLFWALGFWLLARLFAGGDPRGWLALGVVLGLGLQNKLSVLLLGFGLAVGVLLTRQWPLLRSRWPWLGAMGALLLFLPHLLWQAAHGWPTLEFMANATRFKNLPISPVSFLVAQGDRMGVFAVPLFVAGLFFLLGDRGGRPFRAFGWAVLAILVLMITQRAKPYYFAPAFSVVFAAGGVLFERWSGAVAFGRWLRPAYLVVLLAGGALALPLTKPVLAVEPTIAYMKWLGVEASTSERKEVGRLPQFFADRLGWRELAEAVAEVQRALPPEDQAMACVFGQNYGQAGAIDFYARDLGLPPAISGHNSFWLWGPGSCTGELIIVIAGDGDELAKLFESAELAATYRCLECMPYEAEKEIWVARGLRWPLAEMWPQVKSFG